MAKISRFDTADYLNHPEVVAAYLNEAFESGDTSFISAAIGDVARAKGMTNVDGGASPSFETVRKMLDALGFKIVVEPVAHSSAW